MKTRMVELAEKQVKSWQLSEKFSMVMVMNSVGESYF